jgi:hypothetical protein
MVSSRACTFRLKSEVSCLETGFDEMSIGDTIEVCSTLVEESREGL